jgi:hypothetical protein
MSWAASTVYLADTPDARAVLSADPRLQGHVFAFDLSKLAHAPTLAEGASGGLLAIRSPARKGEVGLVPDGFDWASLDGGLAPRLAGARAALKGDGSRVAPPDAPLRWLEDLAARVCGRVFWYQAEASHGDPDAENAWVIDFGGPTTLRFGGTSVALDRAPTLYARIDRRFVRVGEAGPCKSPLTMGLLHLGALLDGPWFEPHAGHFDWASRRVATGE